MEDVSESIEECNPWNKLKILIVFDDMIADMHNNKKLNLLIKIDLFDRCGKLNISFVFITQSYFKVPKDIKQDTMHFFIMKI